MKQIVVFLFVVMFSSTVLAEEVVIIVNEDNAQQLSAADVKAIYSDHMIEWNSGNRVRVFNLPLGHPAREQFSRVVMGMSAKSADRELSNKRITNTLRNVQKTKRERLLVLAVSRYPNSIGYVRKSILSGSEGVRIIATIR